MAVAVSTALATTFSGTSVSASMSTPGGSNRVVLIMIGSSKTTAVSPPGITGDVTYRGQVATLLTSYTFDSTGTHVKNKFWIYYVLEAQIAAGTGTSIAVSFDGSVEYGRIAAWGTNGAYQGAPHHYGNALVEDPRTSAVDPITGIDQDISAQLFDTETGAKILAFSILIGESVQCVAEDVVLLTSVDGSFTGGLIQNIARSGDSTEGVSTFGHGWGNAVGGADAEATIFLPHVEINTSSWSPPAVAFYESFCPYVSRGQVREMVNNVTGLDHLEGEQVSIQADGIPEDSQTYTVESGTLDNALPNKAAVIHVGLPYTGKIKLLKPAQGSPSGTGQMKMRRTYLASIRIFRSLNFKVGIDESHLHSVFIGNRKTATPALPLVTADEDKVLNTRWDKEQQVFIVQDRPMPVFVLAIVLESEIEGGG